MGRKLRHEFALLTALAAAASAATVPVPQLPHPAVLLAIPDGNLLPHGQYRLQGRFQYFTSSQPGAPDTAFGDSAAGPAKQTRNMNYGSELAFGIENRAEVGIQYGQALSLSVKALVWREDLLWPDVVFGARNLFASQEGGIYGVSDSKTMRNLQSESFMTLAKSFARTRAHAGFSVLTHANKGLASLNAGFEQDLGAGAWLGYEVFERFSDFHQDLTLQWRYRNLIALSVSMTEFQSWIRQDGEWGFFVTPSQNNPNGYNSPGISISLQVLGWVPHREKRTLPERVAILEVKNAELEKQVEEMDDLKRRLADLEQRALTAPAAAPAESAAPARPAASVPAAPPTLAQQAVALLKSLTEKGESDLTDPKDIRDLMAKVVALGPEGAEVVKRAAADTGAGPVRVHAVLVMAFSKDAGYEATLRALCSDSDPRIRREALTALVKLGSRAALEDAKRLLSDPDETVALAAGEAYKQLKGAAKTAPARKRGK
jgi:hypothetical protein